MRAGFTLVELLAVMLVLTVALAVTAVALPPRSSDPVDALIGELRAARSRAIRTAAVVEWRAEGSVVVFRPDGSASPARIVRDSQVVVIDPLTGGAARVAR